jgi:hypothetical protein
MMSATSQSRVDVDVTVVPVSVRQHGVNDLPTLMAWPNEDGHWISERLTRNATDSASRMLAEALPPGAEILQPMLRPEPVTFLEQEDGESTRLVLLYTVALPMALCDPQAPDSSRWVPLVHPRAKASEAREAGSTMLAKVPYVVDVVDHWRQALEETGAGLCFLARHWTAPQLRDAYSAVWGYEQDTASFSRWALKRPGALMPLVEELQDRDITEELAETLADASELSEQPDEGGLQRVRRAAERSATNMTAWTALSRSLRPSTAVGLGVVAGAALPAAALVGAAALVAYQASTKGPPATWYTTVAPEPQNQKLEHLYMPRPAWLGAPR